MGDALPTTISKIRSCLLNPIIHLMDNHGRWALCGLSMAAYRSAKDVTRGGYGVLRISFVRTSAAPGSMQLPICLSWWEVFPFEFRIRSSAGGSMVTRSHRQRGSVEYPIFPGTQLHNLCDVHCPSYFLIEETEFDGTDTPCVKSVALRCGRYGAIILYIANGDTAPPLQKRDMLKQFLFPN